MKEGCTTCFYWGSPRHDDPCNSCCEDAVTGKGTFTKWVAVDVFKNIDNHGEAMAKRVIPPPQYDPEQVAFNNIAGQRRINTGAIAGATGVKFDNDKPQWSLLPFKALKEVVDVLTYGAKKYAPDNWKKVPNAKQRYIDAGFRHFTAYAAGEKLDPETGKSHLAHALCCLLYLLAFEIGEDRG
jgi:hypothetical protein